MFISRRLLFLLAMVLSLGLWSGASIPDTALADGPKGTVGSRIHPVPAKGRMSRNQVGPSMVVLPPTPIRPGFDSLELPANDNDSSEPVALPFTLNFFGQNYSSLYVNNNGNVTFDDILGDYTPFSLTSTTRVIIAPFFSDVDTRVGNLVTFGSGTVDGRNAFVVNWPGVGCYDQITDVLNKLQLVLLDRSDVGAGDFDIEFNYEQVQWETGTASGGNGLCQGGDSARVGYSNGGGASFELPGSAVNGAFLDSNLITGLIYNSRNSFLSGRYVFPVRSGSAPMGGAISGYVYGTNLSNPLNGAFVQICGAGGGCNTASTGVSGQYSTSGLAPGHYNVTAFPPGSTTYAPGTVGPITITTTESLAAPDLILEQPAPPPLDTTMTGHGTIPDGIPDAIPVISRASPAIITTHGCTGGTATYQIFEGTAVVASGGLTEDPAGSGTYSAIIPSPPTTGLAHVVITLTCPLIPLPQVVEFDVIYVDPSGTVKTVSGLPIAGAVVTLYRSDNSAGPFEQVPDGSGIMSTANRHNPDLTDALGRFGWDVVAGYYKVRAEMAGCVSPTVAGQPFVETGVLAIPPPVTGLDLRLSCPDLAVTKTGTPNTPAVGQRITYTVTMTNTGTVVASDAAVIDMLPAGVVFASATSSQGSCLQSSGIVSCSIGAMPPSAVVTSRIGVTATMTGLITNTATVAAAGFDPNPTNNLSRFGLTVVQSPPTAVTLSAIEAYSGPGGWIPAAVLVGLVTVFGGYVIRKRR